MIRELSSSDYSRFSVRLMCSELELSRAGYYAWLERERSGVAQARASADRVLTTKIRSIYEASRRRYGSPKIHSELKGQGERVSRKRVARLMRASSFRGTLRARKRPEWIKPSWIDRVRDGENHLARRFSVARYRKNEAWVSDFTFFRTGEGWLFLATVIDLSSRRVVGWATSSTSEQHLSTAALKSALITRSPSAGLIHHSDRGSQYVARDYRDILKGIGAVESWSRPANCLDNAVAESFFALIKTELRTRTTRWKTRSEARAAIVEYISWYNSKRLHSSLGYRSPDRYEAEVLAPTS